jgi:hypothetical protein
VTTRGNQDGAQVRDKIQATPAVPRPPCVVRLSLFSTVLTLTCSHQCPRYAPSAEERWDDDHHDTAIR